MFCRIRGLYFLAVVIFAGGFALNMNGAGNGAGVRENAMHQEHPSPQAAGRGGTEKRGPAESPVRLPAAAGGWKLKGQSRVITAKTIFDYMDGAGELYIGYRFQQLEVHEYASKGADDILVELYWMASSDDAFGLLSGDWGGETVSLKPSSGTAGGPAGARAWPRALYGAGLLRLWSDNLYARILAQTETSASRSAVLEIGRAIAAGRRDPQPSRLALRMPGQVEPSFSLQRDRLCFFRSHLVLNSVYFLSPSNILDLGLDTEAALASYKGTAQGTRKSAVRLLAIRYSKAEAGRAALAHFIRIYLPEKKTKAPAVAAGGRDVLKIEDGWIGYSLSGPFLVLVFESPTREIANAFLNQATRIAGGMEESHE